ncbi:MAG: hypothetical protein DCC57_01885 [Chloroflexi bacterium]|nr:MAG: hypothetical protein DCC57_01885 [Chloroflexota bacterium]
MTVLAAQLAPQRSTQYADLVGKLARPEVQLSPLGALLSALEPVTLGGQPYLRLEMPAPPTPDQLAELGRLATLHALFELQPECDGTPGPWLRPLETGFVPAFPPDLLAARRYRGKTNELLAQCMVNIARAASRFAQQPWADLRLFDPLAGGGTLLFAGLLMGAEVAGVEQEVQDVRSTVTFLRQFAQEARIACRVQEEKLRRLGHRWTLTLGKAPPRRCILAHGDTAQAAALIAGFRPHLLVADLPYGIQHQGPLVDLLTRGLPVWTGMLPPGGALAMAWDATRFDRAQMTGLAESVAPLTVLAQPPYNQLAHRVDRVIKQRDILVARRL